MKIKMKNTMKKINFLTLIVLVTLLLFAASCDDSIDTPSPGASILPERFSVDVPQSIANPDALSGRTAGRTEDDLNGNEIYELLSLFIHVGEESGKLAEAIIGGISVHVDQAFFLSYQSDDDGRVKNLTVVEGASYEGVDYEFSLTITDAESEDNADGGKAMQVFWDNTLIKGVAIIKPYNVDRIKEVSAGDAIYRIEYSEDSENYDAQMIVTIDNLPLANPLDDPYSISTLKMFVGRSGEVVDVFGNSHHPNAAFFTDTKGFNWAFVASGIHDGNIGVAEVGLPPGNLDSNDRTILLVEHSLKNVFTDQILTAFPDIDQSLIDQYLHNTEAPGYFNSNGFIQGGTSPDAIFDPLVDRIGDLVPYNPADIAALEIVFE